MSRLPGFAYEGDPDGFMTAREVVDYLEAYSGSFSAPVLGDTAVRGMRWADRGWIVTTTQGSWRCRAVVLATGESERPLVPSLAASLPRNLAQLAAAEYRDPTQLPAGEVLVVGAAASGVQLAEEIHASGRPVTLCVGEHVRLPRRYRGRDIHAWMEDLGVHDERPSDVDDVRRARRTPSAQLVGSPEHRRLDLNTLAAAGVRPVGRLVGYDGRRLQLSGAFAHVCAAADLKMHRLLQRIDDHVRAQGLDGEVAAADRPEPTAVPAPPPLLDVSGFAAVVWATGSRPAYPWLDAGLLDRMGSLRHDGGILPAPGLYALGLRFAQRRKSNLLDGVGPDALELAQHVHAYLDSTAAAA